MDQCTGGAFRTGYRAVNDPEGRQRCEAARLFYSLMPVFCSAPQPHRPRAARETGPARTHGAPPHRRRHRCGRCQGDHEEVWGTHAGSGLTGTASIVVGEPRIVPARWHPTDPDAPRLVSDPRTTAGTLDRVAAVYATLDPVQLLSAIRSGQQRLVEIADRPVFGEIPAPTAPTLEEFLLGLRTAWREGEVRPTSKPKEKAKRGRRRPDPLVAVTAQLHGWFEAEPWRTGRELLERLQDDQPGTYAAGLLRTLQRRLKGWRRDKAHELVFGAMPAGDEPVPGHLQSVK
jgi:hypothetical protein